MYSYYEEVFLAQGTTTSVCMGQIRILNRTPFISALEFVPLGDLLYNTTDFNKFGLSLVARHSFGYPGPIIRYPDDQFAGSGSLLAKVIPPKQAAAMFLFLVFWNLPPLKVFQTQLTTNKSEPLVLRCPAASFSNSTYYIALYFAHNLESPGAGSRVFNMCKWSSLCPQFVSDFSRFSYLCHPVTICWSYNNNFDSCC